MTNTSVKRKNLSEVVAAKLKDYILEHSLGPGDRLPTEQELAELFGVSRIIIREATKALGFLGILNSAPKRGLTVGNIDMQRVTEYLGFHFAVANYPKEMLLKTRISLETGALTEVIEQMAHRPQIAEELRDITRRLEEADDLDTFIQHDVEFHRSLIEASGLEPLIAFNELIEVFFQRFRQKLLHVKPHWKQGAQGHYRIIEALQGGHREEARKLLIEHMDHYRGTE